MDKLDVADEVKANLIIRELKKKSAFWQLPKENPDGNTTCSEFYGLVSSCIMYNAGSMESLNEVARRALPLLIISIIGAYADCNQRMNALIELIGEEKLKELTPRNKE